MIALAINAVFEPAGLVTGGFSGIAIVAKSTTETLVSGGDSALDYDNGIKYTVIFDWI